MVEEREPHADDGAGEEAGEDQFLLHLDLGQGAAQVVGAESDERNHA